MTAKDLKRDTDRLEGRWNNRRQLLVDRAFVNYTRILHNDFKTHSTYLQWLKKAEKI